MLREQFPGITFSSVFETKAVDEEDQDDFLNCCARLETDLQPEELHEKLQAIELALGKDPPYRRGPRTIDIDILLCKKGENVECIMPARTRSDGQNAELTIPHPKIHERRFVLEPLCELIDSHTQHPVLKASFKELLQTVSDQKCTETNFTF